MPPPVFPANGSLLAAPPFPPSGPGEARFPALSGIMKALRLPIPHPQSLIDSLPRSTRSSCSSCPPWRSWKRGGRFQAQVLVAGHLSFRPARVGANGISQVFRRSFPCLCSVPRPRSNQSVLAISATSVLPPLPIRRRLRRLQISGLTRSFSTHCLRFTNGVAAAHARLVSGWRATPFPGGLRSLRTATRGFSFSCSSSSSPALLTQMG
jgi:hypothetical protein